MTDGENATERRTLEPPYYNALVKYLTEDSHECTKAMILKSGSQEMWGVPDIVGVIRPGKGAVRPFPDEIVSVEVKVNYDHLKGLGQACAYLLFSHKVYLAIATPKSEKEKAKHILFEVLCQKHGIGLIYFPYKEDKKGRRIDSRSCEMRVRAPYHSPDIFYVNKFLSLPANTKNLRGLF